MDKEIYIKQYLEKIYNSNWFSQLNEWTQKSLREDFEIIAKIRYSSWYYNELENVKNKLDKRNKLVIKLRKEITKQRQALENNNRIIWKKIYRNL